MRMMPKFVVVAAAVVALTVSAHSQTAVFVGGGSSALFLESGEAAATATSASPAGVGATCLWTQKSGLTTSLTVTDSKTETGQAWIAWTPDTLGDCTYTYTSSTLVYAYVQLDSVLGNRLYFNGGTLGYVSATPSGAATSNIIHTANPNITEQATLPSLIWGAVSGKALTAAGTDIRPEDAKFATIRATTACGTDVGSSNYTGLGYSFGTTSFNSYYSSSTFNVVNFALPAGAFTAIPVGATPIIFAVNTSDANGFGTGVTNIDHTSLAEYLSGHYGNTIHVTGAAGSAAATVLIREALSGTYNTVEYTSVDTVGLGNAYSQDGGNCNGTVFNTDPLHVASTESGYTTTSYRNRVIGTGESVKELLAVTDAFGYAFWGTSNWAGVAASPTARYLTVDGYDPLYDPSGANYATIKNTIPTSSSLTGGNGYLSDVTFTDLNNGDYPAWSALRIVTATSGTNYIHAHLLAQALQNFVSTTTTPDFVPFTTLKVWREHFVPPTVTYSNGTAITANNGLEGDLNGTTSCGTEAGGDVGGVILTSYSCTTGGRQ